jgi:hypothetical protein
MVIVAIMMKVMMNFFCQCWLNQRFRHYSTTTTTGCTYLWRGFPGRWLRITVFLVLTSPYTAVYDEIRHENGSYSAVILVTVLWHRIQHHILCRIRSYACRILIANGRKTPAWITVKIRCVNDPYLTVYGRISAVFFDQGSQHLLSTFSAPFQYLSTFSVPQHLFSTSAPFQYLSTFSAPQHLFSTSAPFQHHQA